MTSQRAEARPATTTARSTSFLHLVFFASGACGLGYEIAWTRMWAVGLGHEVPSMLAVVAAFFGGFAIGAAALDRAISRSARPARWYVALELAIGLWALATLVLIPWANGFVAELTGVVPSPLRQWLVAFGVPLLGLLPATAAMGATLSAMDRVCSRVSGSGRHVAGLYAANTLGAVAGTLATAFAVIPALGLRGTVLGLALLNFACAALVAAGAARRERESLPRAGATDAHAPRPAGLYPRLFATGLLGIGYEVVGVRVLGQVLENTVYSFATALAIYLVGTAAGAALYQRFSRGGDFERVLTGLLHGTVLACVLGALGMAHAHAIYGALVPETGALFALGVAGELALAAVAFLLPALLMGATFSHLAQHARHGAGGVGSALAINTCSGALAPIVFGVLLVPWIGSKWALLVAAFGYLLLIPRKSLARLSPALAAAALVLLLPGQLVLVHPLPGGRVLECREGVMATVSVVSDADEHRYLKVNDRFRMGGSGRGFSDRRSAHIPLLLHAQPRSALFLGLGAGTTFHATGWHPELRAECAELIAEVVDLRDWFRSDEDRIDPQRQTILTADARRYVRAEQALYDVIVADLFHPARDGAGSLYTREHFAAVRARLAPGGLFCQWLPLYQLDPDTLRVVIRTFLSVFEHARAYLCDFNTDTPALGLVGRAEPRRFRGDWYQRRVTDPELAGALERVALGDGLQVLGCCLGGAAALARFAGAGPINTDDLPVVTYQAPRHVYERDTHGWANLRALLDARDHTAAELLDPQGLDAARYSERLERYWRARDAYLASTKEPPPRSLEGLLASVRASTDFATSYYVLLESARALAHADPSLAHELLSVLETAHPHRREAAELRAALFPK
jgi:spermidine synthase